jgi:transcriptional regulator with XRE-family HTH domain
MAVKKKDSARLAKRLGGNLSERRKQLGWTQEMVAERVGVDAETISRIERGAHLPSLPTLDRLAVALQCCRRPVIEGRARRGQRSCDLWRMDFRTGD